MQAKRQRGAPKLTRNTEANEERMTRGREEGQLGFNWQLYVTVDCRLATVAVLPGVPAAAAATGKWLDSPRRTQHAYAQLAQPSPAVPSPVPHSAFGMGVMRIRNSCGYSNNARLVNFKAAPFTVLLFHVFRSQQQQPTPRCCLRFPCAFLLFPFYCFPLVIVSSKLYGFASCALHSVHSARGVAWSILCALQNDN